MFSFELSRKKFSNYFAKIYIKYTETNDLIGTTTIRKKFVRTGQEKDY